MPARANLSGCLRSCCWSKEPLFGEAACFSWRSHHSSSHRPGSVWGANLARDPTVGTHFSAPQLHHLAECALLQVREQRQVDRSLVASGALEEVADGALEGSGRLGVAQRAYTEPALAASLERGVVDVEVRVAGGRPAIGDAKASDGCVENRVLEVGGWVHHT